MNTVHKMAASASKFKLALIQMLVSSDKSKNLEKAAQLVEKAAAKEAKIIALPECFNSPYGTKYFKQYAEEIPGESSNLLSQLAIKHHVYLIGGSIPEKNGDKIYNTCTVYNPEGNLIAKYSKTHLFDIDIPGKITFKESEILSSGKDFATFDTQYCKIGLGICYDVRFAEIAQIYADQGCSLLVYPGAFNMTTGPLHWEMLARGRSLDNQLFTALVSPARNENSDYIAWGHSTVVGPWGDIVGKLEAGEDILYADIDLQKINEVRQQIPIRKQRRNDLYKVSKI